MSLLLIALVSGHAELPASIPPQSQADGSNQDPDGLDLVLLFGGIGLFLAIVAGITLLRRWR